MGRSAFLATSFSGHSGFSGTAASGQGSLIPIATQTTSSSVSTVDFTSGIDDTYSTYLIDASFDIGVTDEDLYLYSSTDGGTTWISTTNAYVYGNHTISWNGSSHTATFSGGSVFMNIGNVRRLDGRVNMFVWMFNPGVSTTSPNSVSKKNFRWSWSNQFYKWDGYGNVSGTATSNPINAIRFWFTTSATFNSGSRFDLYGLKHPA